MVDPLEAAHHHAIRNQKEIENSEACGCFYCLKTFTKSEIQEWTDWSCDTDEHPHTLTAICPFCCVDSVIGDKSGLPLTPEFLSQMKRRWF
jgi:hypothetical protein